MSTNTSTDPIDTLLDEAFRYRDRRLNGDVTSPPDFTYTGVTSFSDYAKTLDDGEEVTPKKGSIIEVKDNIFRGRGLYATQDISQGDHLIVAKPLVMVMSWEVSDDEDEIDSEDELDYEEDIADAEGDFVEDDLDGENGEEGSEELDEDDLDVNEEEENIKVSAKDDPNDQIEDIDVDEDSMDASMPSGEKRNGVLILRLLEKIKDNPKLWTDTLTQLFPRDEETALNLPPWMCSCAQTGLEIEQKFNELLELQLFQDDENEDICKEIQLRLPLIVRYNVLSAETAPEQYSHFDEEKGMVALNGTALFGPEVSFLNHSCQPNLSRMSVGDVIFFVTNRNISSGEELCFSYIEHELLCESEEKRTAALDMDFKDYSDGTDYKNATSKKQKVAANESKLKTGPMIDAVVQNEIMATQPFERLEVITDLLNNPESVEPEQQFQCDKFTLHSLHAITLDQLGRSAEALPEWQKCIEFTKTFPQIDENTMNLHVQAALCAHKAKKLDVATNHAQTALEMHDKLWGGGRARFLKRYNDDFLKPLRPVSKKEMAQAVKELFAL